MNRFRIVVLALLVLVAGVAVLGFYSPATTNAAAPVDTVEKNGSFTVSERLVLEDDVVFVSKESTVDAETGERRQVLSFEDVTYDTYWAGDGESYTMISASDESAFTEAMANPGGKVIDRDRETHTAIVASESADDAAEGGPEASTYPDLLIHSQLGMSAYEHVGTDTVDGTDVDVYEPKSGWMAVDPAGESGPESVYLSDASGELAVADDGTLHRSNVTLEGDHAATWGEYLLERFEGDTWRATVEYEYDPATSDPTPDWLERVDSE